jgi:hypothetical protein
MSKMCIDQDRVIELECYAGRKNGSEDDSFSCCFLIGSGFWKAPIWILVYEGELI